MTRAETAYVPRLRDTPFSLMQVGTIFHNVSEKVDPHLYEPLSVGQLGVTPQLEGVAQQKGDGEKKLVRPGQIAMNSRSDRRGASGLSEFEGVVSVVYTVLQPDLKYVYPRFAHYLFRSLDFQNEYYRWGTGIVDDLWSTKFERLAQIRIPLPDLETQRRIADYLDQEISEMDALIDTLEKLAASLECRKSLLVKDKLDSLNADTTQMGLFARFISGRDWSEVEDENGEYPVFGSGSQMGYANDYLYDGEAVIFGRKGTLNKPRRISGKFWVVDTAYVAVPDKHLDVNFFYYWSLILPFDLLSTQTAIPSMTATDLKLQQIPIVPLEKQREIADELDREFERMDALIEESTRLIENLKARKTALITEVVTGRKEV